jgi:hypothetical protein
MRRQAGLALGDLMVMIAVSAALTATVAETVRTLLQARRACDGYVQDVAAVDRVFRWVQADVRAGGLQAAEYRLDGDTLRRGEHAIARNVAAFVLEEVQPGEVRVRLRLKVRSLTRIRSSPEVAWTLRSRRAP